MLHEFEREERDGLTVLCFFGFFVFEGGGGVLCEMRRRERERARMKDTFREEEKESEEEKSQKPCPAARPSPRPWAAAPPSSPSSSRRSSSSRSTKTSSWPLSREISTKSPNSAPIDAEGYSRETVLFPLLGGKG